MRSPSSSRSWASRWLPALAWAALISWFSTASFGASFNQHWLGPLLMLIFPSISPEQLVQAVYVVRKLAHFTEYMVLSLLFYRALHCPEAPGDQWRAAGVALVLAGLYALGDELHQWFVPGRVASLRDCLIDFSGAAAGQGIVLVRRALL